MGTTYLSGSEASTVRARVARIITHPSYNSDTADFDVAVLELGGPLPFSRHVQPVCLPAASHVFPPRKKCLISGWGYLKEDFRKHPLPQLGCQHSTTKQTSHGLVWLAAGSVFANSPTCENAFVPPGGHSQGTVVMHNVRNLFPARWWRLVTPCLLGCAQLGNRCPFSGLLTTTFFVVVVFRAFCGKFHKI